MNKKTTMVLSALVLVSLLLMAAALVTVNTDEPQNGGNSNARIIRMPDSDSENSFWSSLWPQYRFHIYVKGSPH